MTQVNQRFRYTLGLPERQEKRSESFVVDGNCKRQPSSFVRHIVALLLGCLSVFCGTNLAATTRLNSELLIQGDHLRQSIRNTPYTALVKVQAIQSIDNSGTESAGCYAGHEVLVTAQVLETYRGKHLEQISYAMYLEQGEGSGLHEGVFIVSLCLDRHGFYWPGVGANFDAYDELVRVAFNMGQQVKTEQTRFADCD